MIETVADALLPAASWILFASLKSMVIIPLVLLIRWLCARWLAPQGRYGLWFAAIACLSIPFGMRVNIDTEVQTPAPAPSLVVSDSTTIHQEQAIVRIDAASAATAPRLSLESKAALIWLLGVAALAAAVLHNAIRYRRMASQAADVDAATDELFQRCKQMLGIRRPVRLLETSQIESPVVVGYWRATLLLPQGIAAQVSTGQLRLVLLHELVHVRRHDILVNWLITIVQIAHWFNPLAWYALRTMRNDMEQACDASVLRHLSTDDRIEYGNTLIRLSDFTPQRTLLVQNASVIADRSQLKARINMIAQFRSRGLASSIAGTTLLMLVSAIAVTQAASAPQPPARAASPAATETVTPPQQPKPAAETRKPAVPAAPAAARKPVDESALQSARFQINYVPAGKMASWIEAAPGSGLVSTVGSVAVDSPANTLLVRDTASNLAAIRQLIANLDVPPQQVLVEAFIASVDSDLLREMTAATNPGGNWSLTLALGQDPSVIAALKAGQQANRAEIISAPRLVTANRMRASIAQGTGPRLQPDAEGKPEGGYQLNLAFTPTVRPDHSIALVVELKMDVTRIVSVPGTTNAPANVTVPSIDTSEIQTEVILESGATVLLDITDWSAMGAMLVNTTERNKGRRLVAFVTPKIL